MHKLKNNHEKTSGLWCNSKIIYEEVKSISFMRWTLFLIMAVGIYTYFLSSYSQWMSEFAFLKECAFSFILTMCFIMAVEKKKSQFFNKIGILRLVLSAIIGCIITFTLLIISVAVLTSLNYEFSSTSLLGDGGGQSINYVIISSVIQLYGETIIIIFPFCFCMKLLSMFTPWSKAVTLISLVFSGLCFGLSHYSTYAGNLIQLILVIGLSSVGFLITFLRVRNINSAFLAHVLYDSALLFIPLIFLQYVTNT
ncbi:TPA: hypothetical protein VAP34_001703 [Streptococcus agalactiae]|nr:hypothetical protein [Streptococcus agalactiae]